MTNNEKKGGSNLTGWAALIMAVAALITAFGIPQIIPELVRSAPDSTSLEQDILSPDSEKTTRNEVVNGSNYPSNPPLSPVEAVQSLRQNMDYIQARDILISAGWRPIDRSISSSDVDMSDSKSSASFQRFGIHLEEIEGCQGTGLGLCSGELELADGRSIRVVVGQGKNVPRLANWVGNFYIEPSKGTLESVDELKEGLPFREMTRNLIAEGWRSPVINPMHIAGSYPDIERDFVMQFPGFDDCQVEDEEVKTCRFTLFTYSDKKVTITTDIKKVGFEKRYVSPGLEKFEYEVTIRSWEKIGF